MVKLSLDSRVGTKLTETLLPVKTLTKNKVTKPEERLGILRSSIRTHVSGKHLLLEIFKEEE